MIRHSATHGDDNDIPTAAGPGVQVLDGTYYAWVIRHLPGEEYPALEFTDAHAWTMSKGAPYSLPADVPQ